MQHQLLDADNGALSANFAFPPEDLSQTKQPASRGKAVSTVPEGDQSESSDSDSDDGYVEDIESGVDEEADSRILRKKS